VNVGLYWGGSLVWGSNVVKFYDNFVDNGVMHILMEFATGGTLYKQIVNREVRAVPVAGGNCHGGGTARGLWSRLPSHGVSGAPPPPLLCPIPPPPNSQGALFEEGQIWEFFVQIVMALKCVEPRQPCCATGPLLCACV
jgi:hypothetical protein